MSRAGVCIYLALMFLTSGLMAAAGYFGGELIIRGGGISMITSVEIKAAIVAAIVSGTLLTTAFVGANIYHAKVERARKEVPEPEISVNRGKALFAQSCAPCHGRDADGGEDAPSLQKLDISEAHISLLVHSGIKGEMPSFAKKYSNSQIESIVKFVKTLAK